MYVAITGIIPFFGREAIFCNNSNATVPDSLEQSTIGCKVIGNGVFMFLLTFQLFIFFRSPLSVFHHQCFYLVVLSCLLCIVQNFLPCAHKKAPPDAKDNEYNCTDQWYVC